MKSTTSTSSINKKAFLDVMSRLMGIFTLLALVFALSISPAFADVAFHEVAPDWLFPAPQDSTITANYVTTKLLTQLIGTDDQLRQRLGFKSPAPIQTPILDPPFAVFRVGLSRLKTFNPAAPDSPFSLLLADENWFPFSSPVKMMPVRFLFGMRELPPPAGCTDSSGCIASSVQVKRLSGMWEFQQIGRPHLIDKLTQYRTSTHFVVWIPVLNVHYLAKIAPGPVLWITAIADDRYVTKSLNVKLREGEEIEAKKVFEQLKDVALSIPLNAEPG